MFEGLNTFRCNYFSNYWVECNERFIDRKVIL